MYIHCLPTTIGLVYFAKNYLINVFCLFAINAGVQLKPLHVICNASLKYSIIQQKSRTKQDGAELCQAQPAKHKLFGSNVANFFCLNC